MNSHRLQPVQGGLRLLWMGLVCLRMSVGLPASEAPSARAGSDVDWQEARQFWSFQKPLAQALPAITRTDWPRQRVDHFILAELERNGLNPSPEADRLTWLRRVTFVLTGLPPTPEEVERFLADDRPEAYERVVDDLLGAARYGERLASLWLNLARYAEDQAHQVGNDVQHFYPNAWIYRKWVVGAFNEDVPYDTFIRLQLAGDLDRNGDTNNLPALGFLGLGPKYYNRGRLDVMADEWEDRVDTVARTFLGLTVACARCHDHKYDPVTMADYYALAGVFASTRMYNQPLEPDSVGETQEKDGEGDGEKKEKKPDPGKTLHIVQEGDVQNLRVFLRGNVDHPGPEVPRRFLQVLCEGEPEPFEEGSGRMELAEAICDPDNPLTARVMVNRLWQMTFGNGLVATTSNFGRLGEAPTHPGLLDDLAVRFMQQGWRIKPLLRELVLSATFRQDSRIEASNQAIDPGNRWLWRMPRQRFTAEMWRDTVLMVSGQLRDEEGPSLELDDPKNLRRTLYGRVSRLQLNYFLMQFDYPDANVHSARRAITTTPMQKLYVLNSPFMWEQAGHLAERLHREAPGSDLERIQRAYLLLYGRPVERAELTLGLRFLKEAEGGDAWTQYAQALLAANELFYLD